MPLPIYKRHPGMASGSVEQKPSAPKGPGVQSFDGAKNTDAGSEIMERPSWQGPGTVVESK